MIIAWKKSSVKINCCENLTELEDEINNVVDDMIILQSELFSLIDNKFNLPLRV